MDALGRVSLGSECQVCLSLHRVAVVERHPGAAPGLPGQRPGRDRPQRLDLGQAGGALVEEDLEGAPPLRSGQ